MNLNTSWKQYIYLFYCNTIKLFYFPLTVLDNFGQISFKIKSCSQAVTQRIKYTILYELTKTDNNNEVKQYEK